MAIRMTGLTSGLDTDTIIEALVSAQKMKVTKVENQLTKSEWTEDIWKDLNTKLYSFYTQELSKFKTQGNYLTKKAASSNESVATATATNNAVSGSHTLAVKSLASSQMVTGARIDANSTVKSLTDLGMTEGTVITITGADGKSSQLEVTGTTTIKDFISSCTSAGLNANFDTDQKRLFVSSGDSGSENAFSITTGTSTRFQADSTIQSLLENASACDESLYDNYIAAADVIKDKLRAGVAAGNQVDMNNAAIDVLNCVRGVYGSTDGITSGVETDADGNEQIAIYNADGTKNNTMSDIFNKYDLTLDEFNNFKTAFNAALEKDDAATEGTLNNIMSDYLADYATASEVKTNFNTIAASRDDMLYVSEFKSAYQNLQSLDEETYSKLKGLDLDSVTDDEITEAGLTKEQVDAYRLLKTNLTTDEMDSFDEQLVKYIKNEVIAGTPTADGKSQLTLLGLDEIDSTGKTSANDITGTSGLSIKWASDAVIELDGAELTGSKNNFSVNGLTLNLTSTTLNQTTGNYDEISLTVSNDTQAAYDMVKNFVKKYNEILGELNTKYDAKSSRGYDPLTDEQKEAMTDDEIEKWETKIKDSLLRRDGTLNSIISTMRSSLQITVDVDGKKYSLSSFGIKTSSDYTEKGKLHIFGDADDDTYSSEKNVLMDALEKNPDAVMKTLAQAGQNLYDALTKKMSKTSLSSALTFYNDKQMDDTQSDYQKKIKEMEKKLTELEDRYYKQFTAMETALAKLQNSSNSIMSFFGS